MIFTIHKILKLIKKLKASRNKCTTCMCAIHRKGNKHLKCSISTSTQNFKESHAQNTNTHSPLYPSHAQYLELILVTNTSSKSCCTGNVHSPFCKQQCSIIHWSTLYSNEKVEFRSITKHWVMFWLKDVKFRQ